MPAKISLSTILKYPYYYFPQGFSYTDCIFFYPNTDVEVKYRSKDASDLAYDLFVKFPETTQRSCS